MGLPIPDELRVKLESAEKIADSMGIEDIGQESTSCLGALEKTIPMSPRKSYRIASVR